jgi:hypothetical protein
MASFLNDLWLSIFTPGPTPTLLVATNASFAALQLVLLCLLVATYSVHFVVLSLLCAGLWYSINWFVAELTAATAVEEAEQRKAADGKGTGKGRGKAAELDKSEKMAVADSDTETEVETRNVPGAKDLVPFLKPRPVGTEELRHRRSAGDSSGYVSTDSEWEKVGEGDGPDA